MRSLMLCRDSPTFNRTIVELKLIAFFSLLADTKTFNRTIVELKQRFHDPDLDIM